MPYFGFAIVNDVHKAHPFPPLVPFPGFLTIISLNIYRN